MHENRHFLSYRKRRHEIMCTYAHYVTLWSRCKMASSHSVTDLEIIPVWISKDEAPTQLSVVGPLFISSLLFRLSRTLLGAWRFSLFRSLYSNFHNRLDLIRKPAFYWVFYFIFPIYPCLFHHPWRFEMDFFSKSVTLWTALQIPLWSKPHLVFRHKVYEIALSEALATQMGVTEAQHQSQLVWIVQIWPIFASQPVDSAGTLA